MQEMTAARRRLTGRQRELIDILEAANGGWMDRAGLADKSERRTLSYHDTQLLEELADLGHIEKREVETEHKRTKQEYRIKRT